MNTETSVRMETCDKCGRKFTYDNGHFVCLPRPSDPQTWTLVLAGHRGCFPHGEQCKTLDEWAALADNDTRPFTWLEL